MIGIHNKIWSNSAISLQILRIACISKLKFWTCVLCVFVNIAHRIKNSTVFDSFREDTFYECTDSFNLTLEHSV